MRFRYSYNTKDNTRHDAEIDASSREDVFTVLKARGIKPYAVSVAPGLSNRVRAHGKTLLAISAFAIMSVLLIVLLVRQERSADDENGGFGETSPLNRMQLRGDALAIEQGFGTGWCMVFSNRCERLLASYAQPGRIAARGLRYEVPEAVVREALGVRVAFSREDTEEVRMLKRIVEGMKEEMRLFLADGGGVREYLALLDKRQRLEDQYYRRNVEELESEIDGLTSDRIYKKWMRRNADLKARGLMMIPIPEALKSDGELSL